MQKIAKLYQKLIKFAHNFVKKCKNNFLYLHFAHYFAKIFYKFFHKFNIPLNAIKTEQNL